MTEQLSMHTHKHTHTLQMTVIFHLDEESSLLIVVSAATSRPAGTTDQTQQTLPGHHPQAAPGQRVALCPLW